MNINRIRRHIRAALTMGRALAYTARSGQNGADLTAGRLARASQHLEALGIDDEFINRYGSVYGKHVAKHYRKTVGAEPAKCWVLRDERWIHVMVYRPTDPAFIAADGSYKRVGAQITTALREVA